MDYQADIIIVGGGIVGCATAYHLTRSGADVLLLERNGIGSGATGRSGGGVRQSARVSEEIPLAMDSVALFPSLSDELGVDIEYVQAGNLRLVETLDYRRPTQVDIARQQSHGLDISWLDSADVLELVPPLRQQNIVGASYCAQDGHCNPFRLVTGFFNKATQGGARVLLNCEVQNIVQTDSGQAIVETPSHTVRAPIVILATGFGSQALCYRIGYDLPLANVRYESMITEPLSPLFQQMFGVASSDLFFRQTCNGGVHFGGGILEEAGQEDTRTTDSNLHLAVAHISRLVTDLEKARLLRTWGGLDPSTPDGMPIIDFLNENVLLASGFCGHGLATGPIVGRYLAQWVLEEARPDALGAFNRDRFDGWLQTKWTPSGSFAAVLATEDTQIAGSGTVGEGIAFMTPPKIEDSDELGGQKKLAINPQMCTGCRMCEVACSIENEQAVSQTQLRIQVVYPSDDFFLPIVCIHCEEMHCLKACKHDAMEVNEHGAVAVIKKNCTCCMDCIFACPTGGVTHSPAKAAVVKCNLCGGDPACVRYCPTQAITFRHIGAPAYENLVSLMTDHLSVREVR